MVLPCLHSIVEEFPKILEHQHVKPKTSDDGLEFCSITIILNATNLGWYGIILTKMRKLRSCVQKQLNLLWSLCCSFPFLLENIFIETVYLIPNFYS